MFTCPCGFSSANKGRYIQHIKDCRTYNTLSPTHKRILKGLKEIKQTREEKKYGLGVKDPLSRCCGAKMVYSKKRGLTICAKCGKSSWEAKKVRF